MIRVYDFRFGKNGSEKILEKRGLDFNGFLEVVHKKFGVPSGETFVLVTTDRTVVDYDKFEELRDGTLYLLQHKGQVLPSSAEEDIQFVPHINTLIECGAFEYFNEGWNSLPCALAELVDNALSATAKNTGMRTIEIRMLYDKNVGKPAIVVLDNGCGMTSKQLNNWAVYRLSKFSKKNSIFESERKEYVHPDPVPRSLNSDISYFGVGGKQAAFHIGESVKIISKPVNSPDVHELVLSKEEFMRKEKNNEEVYKGTILNRKPGDSSHIKDDERFLHDVISEEMGKESFTAVVITGVLPEHISYLKQNFEECTRDLAHIYHYYIHGVNGRNMNSNSKGSEDLPNIDILVTLREEPPKCPCVRNLRDVDNDMQSLYINAAVDTFEFRAEAAVGGVKGTVEGLLRYHPFLYDRETYPINPRDEVPVDVNETENESETQIQARGQKPIFECFWNGRLIPCTRVLNFEWCTRPSRGTLPEECYKRFSGVLFTDDAFKVNASKQKFMELEMHLNNKETIFSLVGNAQKMSKRCNIQKEFTQWLQSCHEKFDKQVKFLGVINIITRTDVSNRKLQHPWTAFSSIELDGKQYKKGQFVKSQRSQPILYGSIVQFLLHGEYDADVFATGGEVEIRREPEALYDKISKIIPISKIDRTVSNEKIIEVIENDKDKLPENLNVVWPEGNDWPQNAVHPAGTPLGPLKVEIVNRKGCSILSRMQTGGQGRGIKLNVGLRVVQHGSKGDKEVVSLVAPYVTNVGHWFKKIETQLTNLGKYTLSLNTMLNESEATTYGGRKLPSFALKFTIKEGHADEFTVGTVSPQVHVGVPFNIPLLIKDGYNHPTAPPSDLQPVLECSGLELTYESTACSGTTFTIKGVKARGKVQNYQQSESYNLNVTIPGLKNDTQTIAISLLPGNPHSLIVKPEANPVKVENRNPVSFSVEVHDEAGNITAKAKQLVHCRVTGLPAVSTDCSRTGVGQLTTKPIILQIINGEPQMLKAEFNMPNQKHVAPVVTEVKVIPSSQVVRMKLFCQGQGKLELRNKEKIEWQAGGVVENLFYSLFDESGRKVPITDEIASSIKVNWTANVEQTDLVEGRLPDVQVPTQISEERFYQVSYQDLSVSSCFSIIPCPDEPAQLKATLPQNTLKLGETLPGHIKLELVDQYGNITKKLTSNSVNDMIVMADGLDKSNISFFWQESSGSILMSGLRFLSGSIGAREVSFSYDDYSEQIIIKLTPGIPSQLQLISQPEQPLRVLNGHGISTPFLVQLCDAWKNPSPDQRVVVEIRPSPPTLTVSTAVISQPVDADGKATFVVNSVKGPKGYYQLDFRGSFDRNPIPGPSVNLIVIPDPNKPVTLQVEYDTTARFFAGGTLPVFSVTVVSDEGSPLMNFNPGNLSMYLWEGVLSKRATPLKCSKPMENEKKDCFYFRDKQIPERVGRYSIQFSLRVDKGEVLTSDQIFINVVANNPVKLGPDSQPPTPVVSFSTNISSRILVENMTLKIMDKFGNSAGEELNGTVVVSIQCPNEEGSRSLPLFEGQTNSVQISLKEGSAHIKRLAVMENSPGENGSRYVVHFKPEVPSLHMSLAPFELPFHFYNDAENQRKMSELSRKRDELRCAVAQHNKTCESFNQLKDVLRTRCSDTTNKELTLRNKLNQINVKITKPLAIPDIDKLIKEKVTEAERLEKVPRRVCSIPNNFNEPDVLGMVGHLAFILDDDAARVISWQLGGDMDCVITRTTAAANVIHNNMRGRQQVMPLDGILEPPVSRSLPHIRNGCCLFDPPGNPVFAKDLLIFSHDKQSCEKVFQNLLGNTILMDDLESATQYRKAVVEMKILCPTILTRQGDRVSAKGKFGGLQNKAPPIHKLSVFGAPLPQRYITLKEQTDLLLQYRLAVGKKDDAEKDQKNHLLNSPETPHKQQIIDEIKKQLEEIEEQLASARPGKRGPENHGEPSGIMAKRPR